MRKPFNFYLLKTGVVLILCLLFSCDGEELCPPRNTEELTSKSISILLEPDGVLSTESDQKMIERLSDEVNPLFDKVYHDFSERDDIKDAFTEIRANPEGILDSQSSIVSQMQTMGISNNLIQETIKLNRVLKENLSKTSSKDEFLKVAETQLEIHATDIEANTVLTPEEKAIFLQINQALFPIIKWTLDNDNLGGANARTECGWICRAVRAIAVVVGAVSGGIIGSTGGPVGIVIGIIVGAGTGLCFVAC